MTPKDPDVEHPGRPDPAPDGDRDRRHRRDREDAGTTEQARSEAREPIENRFPEVESGEQRESG